MNKTITKSPVRNPSETGLSNPADHIGHELWYDRFGMDTGKRDVGGNAFCHDCNWNVDFIMPGNRDANSPYYTLKAVKVILTEDLIAKDKAERLAEKNQRRQQRA